jgi:hypothetical protein
MLRSLTLGEVAAHFRKNCMALKGYTSEYVQLDLP